MKFPRDLYKNNRRELSTSLILSPHYMYWRCSPTSDWTPDQPFPEFSRIKSDQSFNWSAFSTPDWARYNDKKEYRSNYGVIGCKVDSIKHTNLINERFEDNTFGLSHKPIEFNYSHCELYPKRNITPKDKREIRMTFKHNCKRPIMPNHDRKGISKIFDLILMYFHRLQVVVNQRLS